MNIRPALSTDSAQLSSLCVHVQSLHAAHHPDIFKTPQSEAFAITFFEGMLADPTISIFIAEADGQALGYILCKLVERDETPFTFAMRYLLIDQISVRPGARQQGVGRALMKQAELLARELAVQKIQLDSWDFNMNAHAFFEHVGFQKFNFRFWRHL
ncbi:MAG TPA: GNAT family N-acetyltransferase [Anaerolineales bacterium]|nr:GNAT family N-acetyltransferase [Anaerolineales bacterium]